MKKSGGLQAIRGIAVALVVLFHLGFARFRNGWIGVDIFFVLSGFLMWELYRESILNGHIVEFYRRRLKRLLPALSVLLILSNFIFFRFLPHERQLLIKEIFLSNIFASNINYWMGDQYFSNGSLRPLLNLWSIALEIQFYLFFPLIVLIIKKSRIRFLLLFTVSFVSFLLLSQISPQTSFFLLPGRLWEFLMGMLVGIVLKAKFKYHPNFNLVLAFSFAFLAITLGSHLDSRRTVVFQVISVILFSLLIWAGWCGRDGKIVTFTFGKLGDYSYSIYLIHFPLIVLIAYQPFLGNPVGIEDSHILGLFYFLVIFLSWSLKRFVEDSDFLKQNFEKLWGISLGLSFLLIILQPLITNLGFNAKEVSISNASNDRGEFRCGLLFRLPLLNDPSRTCLLPESLEGSEKVLLIGNSHANAIKEAVVRALPTKSVYLLNENNPLSSTNIGIYKLAINNLRPKTIILHSSAMSTNFDALQNLLRFTESQGVEFVVIDPVPTPGFDVPSNAYKLRNKKNALVDFQDSKFTLETYAISNRVELDLYSKLVYSHKIVQIPVADLFCTPFCQIVDSKTLKPLYFDYGHLTKTGAYKTISRIRDALT